MTGAVSVKVHEGGGTKESQVQFKVPQGSVNAELEKKRDLCSDGFRTSVSAAAIVGPEVPPVPGPQTGPLPASARFSGRTLAAA